MNNSLLRDQGFKEKMAYIIQFFVEINDIGEVSVIILWEAAKATVRAEIIAYSFWKKQNKKKEKRPNWRRRDLQTYHETYMTKEVQTQLHAAKKLLKQ